MGQMVGNQVLLLHLPKEMSTQSAYQAPLVIAIWRIPESGFRERNRKLLENQSRAFATGPLQNFAGSETGNKRLLNGFP